MAIFDELEKNIKNLSSVDCFYLLEVAIQPLAVILKKRSDEDIHFIKSVIDQMIDDYFEYEWENAREQAKELVEEYPDRYLEFFDPPANKKDDPFWLVKEDNFIDYFDVKTRYNTTDEDAIGMAFWHFYVGDYTEDVIDDEVGTSEAFAVMAINYIQKALSFFDEIKEYCRDLCGTEINRNDIPREEEKRIFRGELENCKQALLHTTTAQIHFLNEQLQNSEWQKLQLRHQTKKEIRQEIAKKGAEARHAETNRIKEEIEKGWADYYQDKMARNKPASKNKYAEEMASKYPLKFATIRKWLQGIQIQK
ncbi:hypothetical protein QJU89_06770 [Pasteurella skyensis]|uniref:Uncharacterized protein n=1 Tax=Phocoenobacter skyensis TaxID=97481 RepID=A0AAJ6P0G8_9PAST|nr:hypothetical protein [Pasteurella skyensis]MDP8162185.1 hypothetical protein [Pasteurella skyensis]MDP8172649.1 hypothetical protein [Pasteurella skyensis]MDP8176811.1 hypothetical protein [Pasteurella skyensis]MDP8179149.1 hypothetical protein [Pasteurella skyensis]MDP8183396.1 hypothetical protein [Pasteurella skyensis]